MHFKQLLHIPARRVYRPGAACYFVRMNISAQMEDADDDQTASWSGVIQQPELDMSWKDWRCIEV